jgi:hypothetical protein
MTMLNDKTILDFKIENVGGMKYKVTSRRKLTSEDFGVLRNLLGFLGYGQEFNIYSVCDGTEKPEYTLDSPYGKDYAKLNYWVYTCQSIADSSD